MQEKLLMEIVEELIERSEELYLGKQKSKVVKMFPEPIQKLVDFGYGKLQVFLKHFQYPVLMITKGLNFAIKEMIIWCVVYGAVVWGVSIFAGNIQASFPEETRLMFSNILVNLIFFIPIWIASFLPPSILSSLTANTSIVQILLKEIDEPISDAVLSVFSIYRKRVETRISKLKYMIALAWAFLVYIFGKIDSIGTINPSVQRELLSLSGFSLFVIICLVFLQAYEKSCVAIMNNAQIALIESSKEESSTN